MSTIITDRGVTVTRTGRPPKPAGEKYARITITMHPDDLAELDRVKGERGLSRGALVVALLEEVT